jgi:hypothetical protein
MGMFNLRDFLQAQQCVWIARAHRSPIDNWQYDLINCSPLHNISLIRPCDVPVRTHPILHNFATSFKHFYGAYSKCFNNFKQAYVFDNPAFVWGLNNKITIQQNFFGRDFFNTYWDKIRSLKFNDCFNDTNNFKDVGEFAADRLQVSAAVWMRLRACLLRARNVLTTDKFTNLSKPIEEFLPIPTKGSKRFRAYLTRCTLEN